MSNVIDTSQHPEPGLSAYEAFAARFQQMQHSDGNQHAFLLIDASGCSGVGARLRASPALAGRWQCLLKDSPDQEELDASPILLDITTAFSDERVLSWGRRLCVDARYATCVSFVIAPLSLNEMASRLTARLDAELTGNMPMLLRYYDTRIVPVLAATLLPEQRAAFFSCADAWGYLDRSGHLAWNETTFAADDLFHAPLVFSVAQETILIDAGEPDALINLLLRQMPDLIVPVPIPQRHPFVAAQLAQAKQFAITQLSDWVLYTTTALVQGPQFHETAPWREGLLRVAAGKMTLQQVIEENKC